MSLVSELMEDCGFEEEEAVAIEQVVLERFAKFYEKVIAKLDVETKSKIWEVIPREVKTDIEVLKVNDPDIDELYEACLNVFRGCLEKV